MMVDKDFCDRFAKAMKNSGFTQSALADMMKIRRSSLSEIKKYKMEPTMEILRNFLRISEINPDWLLTGKGKMIVADERHPNNFTCDSTKTCVQVLGKIAAGQPVEIDNREPLYCVDIDNSFIPHGYNLNNLLCFEAQGDSMSPKVEDGELVFIERSTDWLNCDGKICAIRIDGECTLKIVELVPPMLILHPINKEHKSQIYKIEDHEITLVGVMVLQMQIKVKANSRFL